MFMECEDAQPCLLTQWLQGLQEQLLVLITQDTLVLDSQDRTISQKKNVIMIQ